MFPWSRMFVLSEAALAVLALSPNAQKSHRNEGEDFFFFASQILCTNTRLAVVTPRGLLLWQTDGHGSHSSEPTYISDCCIN